MDALIGAFESSVSSNAHIIQQFINADFSVLFFRAIESIRTGSVRAQVIDRVVDRTTDLVTYLSVYLSQKTFFRRCCAGGYFFVLGNADDKVISTGGGGDRFEFVPQNF